MNKKETYRGPAMTWECDSNGHMNVMYYVDKFESASRNFNLYLGFTKSYMQHRNLGFVALQQNIKYLKEVFEDDLLYVVSELVRIGNKAYTIRHEMYNAETNILVSTMKVAMVLFDKRERKAIYFPSEFREKLMS